MKAKLGKEVSNGKNYGGDKETVGTYNIIGKIRTTSGKLELREIVTCRFYMGRSASASVVYCSLWVHGSNFYTAGHGQAGGYGYHKQSAAVAEAIRSADIELFGDQYRRDNTAKRNKQPAHISGCGSQAATDALCAIARACGAVGQLLVVSN